MSAPAAWLFAAGMILGGCASPPRRIEMSPSASDGRGPTVPGRRGVQEFSRHYGRVQVSGRGVFDYTFAAAPVDWRVAGGVWRMTRRWRCCFSHSFICGWPDRTSDDKAVVIWNKRSFSGDVTVDLHVGPKMDRMRGRRYEYMRDINVTIAADGKDLTSGYTFTFGGFGNTRSAILRGGDILAECAEETARIARNMRIHHRWWHLRVTRKGDTLAFTVGGSGAKERSVDLKCTDPEPLTGDRVAIWSYDCGIVLARVRISGLPGELVEGPDFLPPERTRTYYDL